MLILFGLVWYFLGGGEGGFEGRDLGWDGGSLCDLIDWDFGFFLVSFGSVMRNVLLGWLAGCVCSLASLVEFSDVAIF